MPVRVAQLWNLLAESRLLMPDELARLRDNCSQAKNVAPTDDAGRLAQWLCSAGAVTRYQAKVLLAGRSGPFHFGDYRTLDRYREGRLAGAFRAIHVPSGHPVLLHFLSGPATADAAVWAAAAEQAAAVRQLVHPQLVRFYELVALGKYKFAVLEDLQGESLATTLVRNGRLPPLEGCRVTRLAALALNYLHGHDLVHAEVCPRNMWVEPHGNAKLLEPPLSRPLATPPSHADLLLPDPGREALAAADYAAPELWAGAAPSPMSDFYALGCALYELLTGQPPFAGGSVQEKRRRHASEAVGRIEGADVPPQLAEAIRLLTAKDPAARYERASTLVDVLGALAGEPASPVRVPPPSESLSQFEAYLGRSPRASEAREPGPDESPPAAMVEPGGDVARTFSARHKRTDSKTPIVLWAVAGLLFLLAAAIIAGRFIFSRPHDGVASPRALASNTADPQPPAVSEEPAKKAGAPSQADPEMKLDGVASPAAPRETKIADDGRALWASPTDGPPLELRYLPLDTQAFLAIRPAQLLEHPEGEKILAALGPRGAYYMEQLKAITGFEAREIEQLIVGLRAVEDGRIEPSLVVRLAEPLPPSELLARWDDAEPTAHDAGEYYRRGAWAYYRPTDAPASLFAVTPIERVGDLLESGGASLPLSPQLERMLSGSDALRDVTLLVSPHFVFGDGRKILSGGGEKLREPLFSLLGDDEIKAVAVSLHLGDDLFVEVCVRSDLEMSPHELAAKLETRLGEVPDRVEAFVAALDVPRFGRQVVNRLPGMVRFLCRHTRVGQDREQAILRCYQPAIAAHNLLMGLELVLAQPAGPGGTATATRPAATALSVEALLGKKISLSFPRDTLETSLELLSREIGVDIQIAGGDLQLEGITKNQSFGIDLRDQPARQVLEQILRLANPDKTAKSLNDPQQKLVYVIQPKEPGGRGTIVVTTRTQALKRGDRLPEAFVP